MIKTAICGAMVTAAAVALVGGVAAGSAEAQSSSIQHGNPILTPPTTQHSDSTATPNTRDMGDAREKPNTTPKSAQQVCTYITGDDVNIRRTPWGTVIGHAYRTDHVSNWIDQSGVAGNYWIELVDYDQGYVLGWVNGAYVDLNEPC